MLQHMHILVHVRITDFQLMGGNCNVLIGKLVGRVVAHA